MIGYRVNLSGNFKVMSNRDEFERNRVFKKQNRRFSKRERSFKINLAILTSENDPFTKNSRRKIIEERERGKASHESPSSGELISDRSRSL